MEVKKPMPAYTLFSYKYIVFLAYAYFSADFRLKL